jgi:hypothetical protein
MHYAKTPRRGMILASGWLSTSIAGLPLPESVDWGSRGWKILSWLLVVTTRDPGRTLLSLETKTMHRHRSESMSFLAILRLSSGNPYLSAFEGRLYTEGLMGRYVDAPLPSINGFGMTLCPLESTGKPMYIYPRISCRSYLLEISKAS